MFLHNYQHQYSRLLPPGIRRHTRTRPPLNHMNWSAPLPSLSPCGPAPSGWHPYAVSVYRTYRTVPATVCGPMAPLNTECNPGPVWFSCRQAWETVGEHIAGTLTDVWRCWAGWKLHRDCGRGALDEKDTVLSMGCSIAFIALDACRIPIFYGMGTNLLSSER